MDFGGFEMKTYDALDIVEAIGTVRDFLHDVEHTIAYTYCNDEYESDEDVKRSEDVLKRLKKKYRDLNLVMEILHEQL